MILTNKHARLLPEPNDGSRLLITQTWPRGCTKDQFDAWIPDLAPSRYLLHWCRNAEATNMPVDEYARRWQAAYREEMAAQERLISDLRNRHLSGEVISLYCVCHDETKCHRSVLADIILNPAK